MKKEVSLLLGALIASSTITVVAATEDSLTDSLPGLVQKDRTLRPYLKDLVSTSLFSASEKEQILTGIESPTLFKRLDFHTLISEMPREDVWVPITHTFRGHCRKRNLKHIKKLLRAFQPQPLQIYDEV